MNSKNGGGVAFGAHVGGFLGGFAMIAVYKWIVKPRENSGEKLDLIIDLASILVAAVARREPAASEIPAIFLHEAGEQSGPFTLSQIQARLLRGAIGRDALYWSEGMSEWQSVLDLAGNPLQ